MVYFMCLIFSAVVALIGIRRWREKSWGECKNTTTLDNKVVIITGANSGIGFEVAKELAKRNAQVILACRNLKLAEKAIQQIKNEKTDAILVAIELDLASLASIKQFAAKIKQKYEKIDILVNNAGIAYPKNTLHFTSDQIEAHFGVNYLGHFYLTQLLVDTLQNTPNSRIITVSSVLHQKGKIDLEKINNPAPNSNLYADSKLANIYFSHEMARRAPHVGVFALCPGWVYTGLFRHSKKWYHYILVAPIALFFMRSARQGAQSIVYCATEEGLQTGAIIRDCRYFKSNVIFDNGVAAKLWNFSERLIREKMGDL